MAFRLFHGHDGVVPLSGRSLVHSEVQSESEPAPAFNPLAAKAASISLSTFGLFGFDFFAEKMKKHNKRSSEVISKKQASLLTLS